MNDVYTTVRSSNDKQELIKIIRAVIPGTRETRDILYGLENNPIFDSELKLEVASKVIGWYRSFEIVDDIIECASNTELMKRLYVADISQYGAFVAVQIKDHDEIEKMYKSGVYEIQCATVSNLNASLEFLEKVIEETSDEYIKKLASETSMVLRARRTKIPTEIEELYEKGSRDVQLAAVTNIHASCKFLEKIVGDEDVPNAIRYRALETFEKISST